MLVTRLAKEETAADELQQELQVVNTQKEELEAKLVAANAELNGQRAEVAHLTEELSAEGCGQSWRSRRISVTRYGK